VQKGGHGVGSVREVCTRAPWRTGEEKGVPRTHVPWAERPSAFLVGAQGEGSVGGSAGGGVGGEEERKRGGAHVSTAGGSVESFHAAVSGSVVLLECARRRDAARRVAEVGGGVAARKRGGAHVSTAGGSVESFHAAVCGSVVLLE